MPPSNTPPVVEAEPRSSSEPGYIGMRPGQRGPRGTASISTIMGAPESEWGRLPRYQSGAEYSPLNNPEGILQLQAQLVSIGLLDEDNVRPGVWDSKSANAYRNVLSFANQQGLTAQEAMRLMANNPTLGELKGSAGSKRAPLTVQLTNPLDIAATAQATAQKMLGRYLSQEDLKPLIERVQASERGAQQKAYTMGGAEGGTVVTPASVESESEDYFKKNYGEEAMGYAAVEAMNEFYSLLGSVGS